MKRTKKSKNLKIKSEPKSLNSYQKKSIMNAKVGNAKSFSNVKDIDENGILLLKSNEFAFLYSMQAVDISLASSKEKDNFYLQLRQMFLIRGLKIKNYKFDETLNFNDIEENLNYTIIEQSNDEARSKILENQKLLLDAYKDSGGGKSSAYYWVVIAESKEKLQECCLDLESICETLANPIHLTRITNQLQIKKFLANLYFQDGSLTDLLYNDLLDTVIPRFVKEDVNYLRVDDYYVQMLSVKRMAPRVTAEFLDVVFNFPNIKSCISIYDGFDTSKYISTLDYNYRSLRTDRNASKNLSDVTEMDEQELAMERLMNDVKTGNEQLKTFTLILAIYGKTIDEIKETYKNLNSYCMTAPFKLDICRYRQLEAWQSFDITSFPFKDYTKPMPSLTLAATFSNTRSFFLDGSGFYLGYDYISGLPIYYDPFILNGTTRMNHNISVIGSSGSGKSFTIKKMLVDLYGRGCKMFILDVENEYGNLVKQNNGHFINLYSTTGGMINPLQIRLLPSEDDEDEVELLDDVDRAYDSPLAKHLGYLESFFSTAFDKITEKEWIVLNQILEKLYKKFGISVTSTIEEIEKLSNQDFPIFDDLIALVKEEEQIDYGLERNELIKQIDILLSRFTSGIDRHLFNGHTTIDLNNDIICFNLQELLASKNDRVIQTQVLSLLTYLNSIVISNKLKNDIKGQKQNVIIAVDEFHIYSEYPAILVSLSQLCRRIRKYSGSFLFATQSIQDLVASDDIIRYCRAIFNNCQYQFIGNLKENDFEAYKDLFKENPLTDTQINFLSLSTQGQFLVLIDEKTRLQVCIDATDLEKEVMGEKKKEKKDLQN